MRITAVTLIVLVSSLVGCHYYEEFRVMKGTADVKKEQAELMRAYRLCLQKYENDPPKAREYCAPYTQSLREIDVKSSR